MSLETNSPSSFPIITLPSSSPLLLPTQRPSSHSPNLTQRTMENHLLYLLLLEIFHELIEPCWTGISRRIVESGNDVASVEIVVSDVDDLDGGGDGGGGGEEEGGEVLRGGSREGSEGGREEVRGRGGWGKMRKGEGEGGR